MRNFSITNHLNKVWMLALVAFMVACSQFEAQGPNDVNLENAEELASAFSLDPYGLGLENARAPLAGKGTASVPVSAGGITPYIIDGANEGGNRTCDEVASAYGIPSFETSFEQINTPDFNGNTATFGAITATTDGTFVSWSIEVPEGYCVKYLAAVVKGSNDSNVYFYEGDVRSDSGLASPPAGSGPAGLSNLRFCYTLEKKPDAPMVKGDEECFEDGLILRATLDGSIPGGYTLQWYTKNNGEFVPVPDNDPKLDEVGSIDYYAAFVNGCSSEMSKAATLTIWALPAAPISGGDQEGDCDDILTAEVDAPDGVDIVWYDAPTGGNVVEDPSLVYDPDGDEVQTVTYYAEAVDKITKCVSGRTAVTLTLNPCPPSECWAGESATGKGSAFPSGPRTWFEWNTRHQLIDGVDLVYGRNLVPIGRVSISDFVVGGMRTITVTLNEGIRFAEVSGALKVIASNTQFTRFSGFSEALNNATINGNTATISVPDRRFYFVHGDIERIIECPIED